MPAGPDSRKWALATLIIPGVGANAILLVRWLKISIPYWLYIGVVVAILVGTLLSLAFLRHELGHDQSLEPQERSRLRNLVLFFGPAAAFDILFRK